MEDIPRGPFSSEIAYLNAHITAYLEHVQYYPLNPHCFLAPIPNIEDYNNDRASFYRASDLWNDFVTHQLKTDCCVNRTDYTVVANILSDRLIKWFDKVMQDSAQSCERRFAIQHPDSSVDNIYIDEECNVTCLIDWEYCTTVPLAMTTTAPGLPQHRDELSPSLISAFEAGFRNALDSDQSSIDYSTKQFLASCLSRTHPLWLFTRITNLDSKGDYHLFTSLWNQVGDPNKSVEELFHVQQALPVYKALHQELKENDGTEEEIAREESKFWMKDKALARKMTLVSEWSARYEGSRLRSNGSVFVADKRLWKWIMECERDVEGVESFGASA